MLIFAKYVIVLLLGCLIPAAQGQSPGEQKAPLLPPATKGQPAFSFEGGKRITVQKSTTPGLQEYGAGGSAKSGTGIVEIGTGANSPVKHSGTGIRIVPSCNDKLVQKATSPTVGPSKGKQKAATTVVQILGPDGKMQYKEVLFIGTLTANKRAPNITDVKDGEGKVKEYDWHKKGQ